MSCASVGCTPTLPYTRDRVTDLRLVVRVPHAVGAIHLGQPTVVVQVGALAGGVPAELAAAEPGVGVEREHGAAVAGPGPVALEGRLLFYFVFGGMLVFVY